ncbi:ABC transporter ATP-binding protein [Candidatus Saccharibacteria bacterium]|nr:ABC transporter ATP-binding protein [Candidatus Saccharibacteria bacterium]
MIKVRTNNIRGHAAISLRLLKQAFVLRADKSILYFFGALLEISSSILAIYAGARIAALLAQFITSGTAENIWLWLWISIGAGIGVVLGFAIMGYAQRILYFAFAKWSTVAFQSSLCRLDLSDFYDESTRNQINKVAGGYTWQIANLANANFELIYGMARFIAITFVVSQITWWIVPLLIIFLIPSLIAEGRISKILWFVWDEKGDERHTFWGLEWIMRQPKGQMELRSTQAKEFIVNKVNRMLSVFYKEQERKYNEASRVVFPTRVLEVAGTAIGSITLLRQVLSGSISLERYFFLSGALLRVGGALSAIFGTLARMQDMLIFAASYFELIDKQPHNIDIKNAIDLNKASSITIEFRDVCFTYPGEQEPVFKNLSLRIRNGEHVALVGENGAGKTTLIKLLMRFYQPDSGQILINGHDLNDLALESWYSQIATLFQEFNQYPLPIDENITIGRSESKLNAQKLEQAATFAGVDKLVSKYPYGWKTVLDASFKKGTEPSGGQWQRVALARAFYRNANVMVLDEPTSAIDANAEYKIFNSIFENYKHKTALIVSHRFSTVRRANHIIVLDKGKIIEQGSHKTLIKKQGLYYDLFSKQAEGYR